MRIHQYTKTQQLAAFCLVMYSDCRRSQHRDVVVHASLQIRLCLQIGVRHLDLGLRVVIARYGVNCFTKIERDDNLALEFEAGAQ